MIGIDTGGTFTDCVVIDEGGRIVTAKASSTPGDFSEGVMESMESLRLAGEKLGHTTEALLRDTDRLALGTAVGTNAMLQRRGARVGLVTTRGHRDVIHIMRGARGVPGQNNVQVLHFPESGKPDPIVLKPFIAEVSERVDCKGQVVVELNEEEAEAAIRTLVAKGVEAIAICFLWSFKHAHPAQAGRPAHLRQRGHRAPGRRHQHDLLGLARLADDRDQRAAVLGPALRDRRGAPPHRVPALDRCLHIRHPPGVGLDRPGAGHGDLALSRLQHAQQDALVRSRAQARRDDHRRHQPVPADRLPRHRPVGREVATRGVRVHAERALALGATPREVLEALEVAVIPGGMPGLWLGVETLEAILAAKGQKFA